MCVEILILVHYGSFPRGVGALKENTFVMD